MSKIEVTIIVLVVLIILLLLFPMRFGWEADAICRAYGYEDSVTYGLPLDYEHTYCLEITEKNLNEIIEGD